MVYGQILQPGACRICNSEQRHEIDALIADGVPMIQIAKRYPDLKLSLHLVSMHRNQCLEGRTPLMRVKYAGLPSAQRLSVLDKQIKTLCQQAKATGSIREALTALRERVRIVELQAKIAGDIDSNSVHVTISPDWAYLRAKILVALHPYPDAKAAVLAAIRDASQLSGQFEARRLGAIAETADSVGQAGEGSGEGS